MPKKKEIEKSSKKHKVKLYVYQFESEKIYIDTFEAENFEDFVIATGNFQELQEEEVQNLYTDLQDKFNKQVLIVDKSVDVAFYGLVEDDGEEKDD